MVSRYCIYAIFLLLFLSISCGRTPDRRITDADRLIDSNPDSALSLLSRIDPASLDDANRNLLTLFSAKAADKAYKTYTDEQTLEKMADFYENNTDSLRTQSLFYYGLCLSYNGNQEKALIPLTEAYNSAKESNDHFYAGMSAREISNIYGNMLITDKCLKWALKEKENYDAAGKPIHSFWAQLDILNALIWNGQISEAQPLYDRLCSSPEADNPVVKTKLLSAKADMAVIREDPKAAIAIFRELIDSGRNLTSRQWSKLSEAYLLEKESQPASSSLDSARMHAISKLDSLYVLKIDAILTAQNGNFTEAYQKALEWGELMAQDADSKIINPGTVPLSDFLEEKDGKAKAIQKELRASLTTLGAGILLLAIAFISVAIIYRVKLKLLKAENERFASQIESLYDDLSAASNIPIEKNDDLEHVEEKKDDDFMKAEALKKDLRDLLGKNLKMLNELCELSYKAPANEEHAKKFHSSVVKILRQFQSDDTARKIEKSIDHNYDGWMLRFRKTFPGLHEQQYKLAAYLFIGFSYRTIALLMGKTSVNAVYIAKHNLKADICGIDSPEAEKMRVKISIK
ncbi:MAG: hypothetical protein K2M27_06310 [Muribaculaceae bacterium]|nr:hypothetical protein [Muribaculaceae bacterium]